VARSLVPAIVVAALVAVVFPGSAQSQPSMADLVGQYADWLNGRRSPVDLHAADLDVVRRELARLDPAAIAVAPALKPEQAREYRRRVLTTFAVEVAAIGSRRNAAAAGRLVEWACAYVRTHIPLSEFDRAWQLTALSVLEGAIDSQALDDHVNHARPIFAGEPRLHLARAIVDEQFNAPSEILVRTETAAGMARLREAIARREGESFRTAERAIARFQEASALTELKGEALLRAGHVQMRLSRYDAALASWKDLEPHINEPAMLFLLHLFRGMALEGRGRVEEARVSYESALKLSPGAHSATMRLAALAFRYGHGDEPTALTDALIQNDDPRRDPWWSYYAADWRLYYPRIARLRAFVKHP
jgi:tetratricopeptide (TPR) repeat protein